MDKKQTRIKVVIRVRPSLNPEAKTCVRVVDNSVEIFNHRNIQENLRYSFSGVHDETTSQLSIYSENVKPMLSTILSGENVSVFAYGPTGAGKTHTMLGTPSDPGIIPRVVNGIFQEIDSNPSRSDWTYSVAFSFLEIYNEKVQDLLEPKNTDLPIREDGNKNIFVSGLAEREISSFDEFKGLFGAASNNRTVAATKLNDRSSRSHSILLLKAKKCQKSVPYMEYHGKMYLIDLAGSEDNRRTGNKGIRLKESGAINKSLFVLGEVVDAINNGLPRIPYRNSKLTRLLQDSIGGSCHAVMITNISPEETFYYDTYCTLNLATKSKKIVNTNTVCVREKITVVVQPTLKRPLSASSIDVIRKRQKLSPNTTPPTAPKHYDPASFISPLLRRQAHLEDTVNQRLGQLEHNLLQQMRGSQLGGATLPGTDSKPDVQQLEDLLQRTSQQLQMLKKQQASMALKDTTNIQQNKMVKKKAKLVKSEAVKSEALTEKVKCERVSMVTEVVKSESLTPESSPLFVVPAKVKRKGVKSTAARKESEDDPLPASVHIDEGWKIHISSDTQLKHNEDILRVLNTGTMKELQMLQTVGKKRAQLILAWRESNGMLSQVEDLKLVPGLTTKYVDNFQRSNLFSKICF